MRTAIFGGSFDPVHIGHLILAESARAAFALDRVVFVPANISPHKDAASSIGAETRCALLRAAIQGNANFELSACELERDGISYTIDTVLEFGASEDAPVYCLIGADIVPRLPEWRRADELARLARFIVAGRDGKRPAAPAPFRLEYLDSPEIGVSSTLIRKRLALGQSVRYLVPEAVHELLRADIRNGARSA